MKKIIITFIFIVTLLLSLQINAEEVIKVSVNGKEVIFSDDLGNPFISNEEYLMIPIRAIAEALNMDIQWIDREQKIILTKNDLKLTYTINNNTMWVNDDSVIMDVSPIISNNRTYIPIEYLTDNIGATADWNKDRKTLEIEIPMIGINLSHIHYWSSQWMFKDAMKQSKYWWVQKVDGSNWHDPSIDIPMGENGYPLEIPYNSHMVHTAVLMHMDENGPLYPAGDYILRFKGEGEILLYGDSDDQVFMEANKDHYFTVTPSHEGIHITILKSNKDNPIRDIQVMMPGFGTAEENPFHPEFIEHITPFSVVRFMKPTYVEENSSFSWEERSTPNYMTQSRMAIGGLSHEYIIKLSNEQKKDPWINIPHNSSDDYVRALAEFYKSELDQERMLYIEYSNEPWNPLFPAYEYGIMKGEALSLGYGEEANARYGVKRTMEMKAIFSEVYGTEIKRVTWVLNTWSARKEIGEYILDELDQYNDSVDALAIAPYFGGEIANDIGDGYVIENDQVFSRMEEEINTIIREEIRWHKEQADKRNIRLITYEAGMHFVSLFYPDDKELVDQMIEVNSDPRIEEMYALYWDVWNEEAGDLTVLFELVEEPNNYGDFGLKRHYESENTPKWDAVMKYRTWD